jgi:glycerophosphoryl diester phosphodiesterase
MSGAPGPGANLLGQTARIVRTALTDFVASWREIVPVAFLYHALSFVLLVPAVAGLLRLFVSWSGEDVLTDLDILFFVLSVPGALALVLVGGVSLALVAMELACIMAIALGAARGHRVRVVGALAFALRRVVPIAELTVRMVWRLLVVNVPFLAAGGATVVLLLARHDINFYLSARPPEFLVAAGVVGVLLGIAGMLSVRRLLGWAVALPLLLFAGCDPSRALRVSQERMQGERGLFAAVLVGWAAVATLTGALPVLLVGTIGRLVLPALTDAIGLLVAVMSAGLLAWALLHLLATIFNAGTLALLMMRLFAVSPEAAAEELPRELERAPEVGGYAGLNRRRIVAGVVAAAVAAGVLGYLVIDSVRLDDDVLVIGHRGASAEAPENTLAAVALAVEQRVDYVEIDVLESADGEVVVIHDRDLMRVGGSPLEVADGTAAEIRSVDIGSGFDARFAGERVPTLEEVLELCRDRANVLIELKSYGREVRLEERVIGIVERLGMQDQITAMSLKRSMVARLKELRPEWRVGLLTARALGDLTRTNADFLAVNHALATTDFVRRAHAAGQDVYVWTVNDALNMSRFMSRGVDGLITDYPARARDAIDQRRERGAAQRLLIAAAFWIGVQPAEPEAALDTEG